MIQNLLSVFLISVLLLLSSSCNSNRCEGVDCQNGGICDFGECVCAVGYYEAFCETTWISKFVGNYNGTQDCASTSFSSNFSQESLLEASLSNFANSGQELNFKLTSATKIRFDNQLLNVDEYSGSGELKNDSLSIYYTVVKNIGLPTEFIEDCAVTYIRF